MTSIIYFLCIALCCSSTAVAQNQVNPTEQKHHISLNKSVINWHGYYLFRMGDHEGTVNFKSGYLVTNNGHITGGRFIADMTSITNPLFTEKQVGPVEHLRDTDFFDVKNYPEASLMITEVNYHEDSNQHQFLADLTIKGITKPIEFWGKVNAEERTLETDFKIDRTRWEITYNNKMKDHAISDGVDFNVVLQFK